MKAGDLWVVIEHSEGELHDISKELCSQGRRMKSPTSTLVGILAGNGNNRLAGELRRYGVEKVYLIEDSEWKQYNPEALFSVLSDLALEKSPSIILLGSNSFGNALAPRLAVRTHGTLVSDCVDIRKYRKGWAASKPIQGGRIDIKMFPDPERIQLFTLKPGAFEVEEEPIDSIEIIPISFQRPLEEMHTRIVGFIKSDPRALRLEEAELIVAGGKGLGNERTFKILEEMAELLKATVGGSRMAFDMGWIPYERQIGLTGKRVSPRLIITVGISGVFEFAIGIKDSKFIVTINNDPSAPIFNIADVGIVGDLNEILPMLSERLRTMKG
jgi:electron transfer flavoprotein alpha subunit